MSKSVVILDYGAGNLRSVFNALHSLGCDPLISSEPSVISQASAVILPGVGAAAPAMAELKKRGLVEEIDKYISAGNPFMGVCLGMQLLFTMTDEGGQTPCLGIIPGQVKKFTGGLKIPHMGWNQVKQKGEHPVFKGIPDDANFYFVHSYYVLPDNSRLIAGETEYAITFCSAVAKDNLVAVQFHPEKSGDIGLRIYKNFLDMAMIGGLC